MKKLLFILLVCLCFAVRGQTNGYTIPVGGGLNGSNPTDGTTYYGGQPINSTANTAATSSPIYVANNCKIGAAFITWQASGTVGSNEAINIYIRVNDTTDNLVATMSNTNSIKFFNNTSLNISLNAGDFINVKIVSPTWATNPTIVNVQGYVLISPTP